MRHWYLLLCFLVNCCPSPEMTIVEGNQEHTVEPGEVVQLEASYGDWRTGPGRCGAHWFVNYVEGGTAELGWIDDCGRYEAPAEFPEGLQLLAIEANEYGLWCADCCPYAYIQLYPRP